MTVEEFNRTFDRLIAEAVRPELRDQIQDDVDLISLGVNSLTFMKLMVRMEDELLVFWSPEQLAEQNKATVVGELRTSCWAQHLASNGTDVAEQANG